MSKSRKLYRVTVTHVEPDGSVHTFSGDVRGHEAALLLARNTCCQHRDVSSPQLTDVTHNDPVVRRGMLPGPQGSDFHFSHGYYCPGRTPNSLTMASVYLVVGK